MSANKAKVTTQKPDNRVLRIILLSIGGVLLLAMLCCACTLAIGWYTGDFFVEWLLQLGG
jgi:hypothetical protein